MLKGKVTKFVEHMLVEVELEDGRTALCEVDSRDEVKVGDIIELGNPHCSDPNCSGHDEKSLN